MLSNLKVFDFIVVTIQEIVGNFDVYHAENNHPLILIRNMQWHVFFLKRYLNIQEELLSS